MFVETPAVAFRVEDILTGVQETADSVEIEEELELADWVVPCSGVIAADERGDGSEHLHLSVVLPPGRAEDEAVAVAQLDRIVPKLVPPDRSRRR